MRRFTALSGTAALLIAAPLLTGCTSGQASDEAAPANTSAEATAQRVQLVDGWAKAGEGMTGVFGTLTNTTDSDLVITGITSDAAAMVELHEVVDGVMRKIAGDVVIPAGGTFELAPGDNHIMLMQMPAPIAAGEEITLTLAFDDGSSVTVSALVKDYSAANEEYAPGTGGDQVDDHAGEMHTETESMHADSSEHAAE